MEVAAARVCREAGARVATSVKLRDMILSDIRSRDTRNVEVVANGLPLWGGAQLVVDTTLVSPWKGDGSPQPRAADADGAQLATARRRKEVAYPELTRSRRCRLVVLGLEVGGRWSEEAASLIRCLAWAKARSAPALLRRSVAAAWSSRWSGLLAVAAQRAFAASLLELPLHGLACADGAEPALSDLLAEARFSELPPGSRLA